MVELELLDTLSGGDLCWAFELDAKKASKSI